MNRHDTNFLRRLMRGFHSEPLILELSEGESERLCKILNEAERNVRHHSSIYQALVIGALFLLLLAALAVVLVVLGVAP